MGKNINDECVNENQGKFSFGRVFLKLNVLAMNFLNFLNIN